MNYFYQGSISCKNQEDTELVRELLTKHIFNHPEVADMNDKLVIQISDENLGDITDKIDEFCKDLRERKILIDGYISYFGDGNGEFSIEGSEWSECFGDEYMVMNMETDTLIKELNRRGYFCYPMI